MKLILLVLLLCLQIGTVWAQTNTFYFVTKKPDIKTKKDKETKKTVRYCPPEVRDSIVFEKTGTIGRKTLPNGILIAKPGSSRPGLSTDSLNQPASSFMNSLRGFADSLANFKKKRLADGLTKPSDPVDRNWEDTTFRQEYWRKQIYESAIRSLERQESQLSLAIVKAISSKNGNRSDSSLLDSGLVLTAFDSLVLPLKKADKKSIEPVIRDEPKDTNCLKEGTFRISRNNLDNQIISEHLNRTRNLYKGIPEAYSNILDSLIEVYKRSAPRLNYLLTADTLRFKLYNGGDKFLPFNIEVIKEIELMYPSIRQIYQLYDKVLNDNRAWIEAWLWYTAGNIVLNPFVVTDPVDAIRNIKYEISLAEEKLKLITTYTDCCEVERLQFENANGTIEGITLNLAKLNERKEKLLILQRVYKSWVASHSVKSKVFYQGRWVSSTVDQITWEHHYDADDKYSLKTDKKELPEMVAETDRVAVLVHNIKSGDTVTLKTTEVVFQPIPKFDQALETFTDVLAEAFQSVAPIQQLTGIISSFGPYKPLNFPKKERQQALDSLAGSLGKHKISTPTDVRSVYDQIGVQGDRLNHPYTQIVIEYLQSQYQLYWLLSQTKPILSLNLKADEVPAYRTELFFPSDTLDESKKVTYQGFVNGAKTSEFKYTFKKYMLGQWLPTIGIVYVHGDRSSTVFNDSTSTFRTDTGFDNFEALVGVKWYPWKTNSVRDKATTQLIKRKFPSTLANQIRGNSFKNTSFLSAGFGVRHGFLKNYYLSLGADITPGLSLLLGGNVIFRKRYELINGAVSKQYERPAPYVFYGLSIDPGVVTNLLKLFK